MSRKFPDWGFSSSCGITSSPVADWGYMPTSILTGYILHQWIAVIETHLIWLLHGSSLDFGRFISDPLHPPPPPRSLFDEGFVFRLFSSWVSFNIDSTYLSSVYLPRQKEANRITPLAWHVWQGTPRKLLELISQSFFFFNQVWIGNQKRWQ